VPPRRHPVLHAAGHLAALALLLIAAEVLPRVLGSHDLETGLANARRIVDVEQALGIASERPLAGWLAGHATLSSLAAAAYGGLRVPVTAAVLVWTYVRHPGAFAWVRSVFVSGMVLTVVGYTVFPAAPPRFLPTFQGLPGDAVETTAEGAVNTLAAMPSGHVLFALVCALAGWRITRRSVWWLYPSAVTIMVVASAHHFWLDAAAAALVAALATAAATLLGRVHPAWAFQAESSARRSEKRLRAFSTSS
jgi:hypothetical protein